MKRFLYLGILAIIPTVLYAEPTLKTKQDFQQWLEAQVLCQRDFFADTTEVKRFATDMRALKFKVDIEVDDESGLYNGEVFMGTESITVFGFPLKQISFYIGSGSNVMATVEATPEQLVTVIKNHQLANHPLQEKLEGVLYGFASRKPTQGEPSWAAGRNILIGKAKSKDLSTLTCQLFDG